ncbi:MAG: PAS domain S-box protein [Desulfonatronovibrionaceae bacterium]
MVLTASPAFGSDHLPPFESLFQEHGSVMLIIDLKTGNIVRANQAAVDFYGFSEDALTSMNIHDINTLSFDEVEKEMRAAAGEQRNFFRFRHRLAGNEERIVEVRSYPYSAAGQEFLYSIITDITPRVRAARAFRLAVAGLGLLAAGLLIFMVIKFFSQSRNTELRLKESEEMFRQMAENISEVFWLRSADNSKVLYISPAYEKVWGRTCQSLYDHPDSFIKAVHPQDREKVIQEYTREINSRHNGRFNAEYRVVRPDQEIRWVWARSFPVKDSIGRVVRYTGLAVDITRQKVQEQKNREQFLESMFSSIQDGISVLDHELNIVHVNPVMEKWFADQKPLTGKKCHQVYHNRNTPCSACPSLRAVDSGMVESCTVRIKIHEYTRWHEVFSYPMLDKDTGHPLGFVEFIRDITRRKKNEQELIQVRPLELRVPDHRCDPAGARINAAELSNLQPPAQTSPSSPDAGGTENQ